MTSACASALSQLERAWALADRLFTLDIGPAHALTQPISLRHPFVFYLGHLPSFLWSTLSRMYSLPPVCHKFDALFVRGMDPDVDDPSQCHDRPDTPECWPLWEEVDAYKGRVRDAVRRVVRQGIVEWRVLCMCWEHDLMHLETLRYMIAQMKRPVVGFGVGEVADDLKVEAACVEWVRVGGGEVWMGDPEGGGGWVWDNERDASVAAVDDVLMRKYAVSVGEYVRFMSAGGYRRRELWGEDGDWEWICKEGRGIPASWGVGEAGELVVLVGEEVRAVEEVAEWPVSVSLAEARAYCRWAGGRLMTEAEYLMAAYGEKGARYGGSVDVGVGVVAGVKEGEESESGVVGLVGNGWEMTGTLFDKFDGFEAAVEYPQYSADFFDGRHYVFKGGSWCTMVGARPSFRNFYQAKYSYVFTKFRVVKDI